MNLRSLSTRDRRAVSLGAAAFAPMLLWMLVVGPFTRQLHEERDRLDRSRDLLQRELEVVGSARSYAAVRAQSAERLAEAQRQLIYATSDASARATLVGFAEERARASGVEVDRVEAMTDSVRSGALRGVSVRVAGMGDLEGILTLLGALESGSPFLVISQLEIERRASDAPAMSAPAIASDTGSTGAHPAPATPNAAAAHEVLTFRLLVTGFRAEASHVVPTARNLVASR
jgi:hypothetical protein